MNRQSKRSSRVKRSSTTTRVQSTPTATIKSSLSTITNTRVAHQSSFTAPSSSYGTRATTTSRPVKRSVAAVQAKRSFSSTLTDVGKHELPPLPFKDDQLEPYISARTLSFHHGKHHNTYVTNLNNLIKGKDYENQTVEEIIVNAHRNKDTAIFNNAAQHFNHDFFWKSLKPSGGGIPENALGKAIEKDFGSFQAFRDEFKQTAATHFGSGWAFLAVDKGSKKLKVMGCHDADTPILHDAIPIITTDVWEHSYYLDYQNRRPDYVEDFLKHLANWDFADENYAKAQI